MLTLRIFPAGTSTLLLLILAGLSSDIAAQQEDSVTPTPLVWTTRQDHQNMLEQLGITKLRPGRSGDSSAPNAANEDESKANPFDSLPALLRTSSGEVVDTAEDWWKTRRPELVELVQRELYGFVPDDVPDVAWKIAQTRDVDIRGVEAIQHEILGEVDNSKCPEIEVKISMSLTLPKHTDGPVPILMSFGWTAFEPNPFSFMRRRSDDNPSRPPSKREELILAGWGCATLNPSSIQADSGGWAPRRFGPGSDAPQTPTGAGLTRGIIGLTNHGQARSPEQWGALRAWAWGASRALDFLSTVPEIDAKHVGIAGVSRYGKAALVTLAMDQRFAAGLLASSGAGGTALYRRDFGESLENVASSGEYHWMAGNFLGYAAEESSFGRKTAADLPVDSHTMLALCAPRLTFISHGVPSQGDAHWIDHQGSFMASIAAQPVFRLLGAKGLGRTDEYMTERMPAPEMELLEGNLAWRQHTGGHTDGPNVSHFIRWAESRWNLAKESSASATSADPDSAAADSRSLKTAVGDRFKLGVGISQRALQDEANLNLIKQHFQILTPENCMKPQGIHPAEDRWNFNATDQFADIARRNQLEIVGHCLLWAKDDRTDDWMMKEADGQPVSRETLLRRVEAHVTTVVERYADVATMWDVVNEALNDSGEDLLRDSIYSRTTGMDFIVTAFQAAKKADPDALLIYNDYNGHKPGKREKLLQLLRELKDAGAPIDAYGMQGHFELGDNSIEDLRVTFEALRSMGLKIVVSELDIDVVKRGRWWADGGKYRPELQNYDPYVDGLNDELQAQLASEYVELFKLFDEFSDSIERVSFWNLHDGQSWLNYFPWRRTNHPLLFDRQRQPKPAFNAVYEWLQNN